MNNQNPLVPEGLLDPKNKRRARVKIGVFFVLAVHGVGLLALLLQGCHKEDPTAQNTPQATNAAPAFDATNPAIVETAVPAASNSLPAVDVPPAAPVPAAAASEYTVASGDKFVTIAKKFNVTVAALRDANPGVEPTKLQIGKSLHIPAATSKAAPSTPSATAVAESANGSQTHTVKSGDTLIKIAQVNHTTVRAIRTANNLRSDRITVGQKLKIPAKSSQTASTETASANPSLASGTPISH